MGQFWVDLVDEIAEICTRFVVNTLEEHDGGEVLLEILDFVTGELTLQDVNDMFFLADLDLLCQFDYLLFEGDYTVDVPS